MKPKRKPPNAGKGRKKGNPNKLTKAAKEAFELAFEGLGGIDGLIKWARKNRTEFYRLYARLIPQGDARLLNAPLVHIDFSQPIVSAQQASEVYQELIRDGGGALIEQAAQLRWEPAPPAPPAEVVAEVPAPTQQRDPSLPSPVEVETEPEPRPGVPDNVVSATTNPRLAIWAKLAEPRWPNP